MSSLETVHASAEMAGPHIPSSKGANILDWNIGGIHITNTVFSTWIFMLILFVLIGFLYAAIRTNRFPKLKTFGLDIVSRIFSYATSLIGDA